ncbi:MAG: hypothetical protein ACREJB_10565, partial [Planctomycetaceae bacterium]
MQTPPRLTIAGLLTLLLACALTVNLAAQTSEPDASNTASQPDDSQPNGPRPNGPRPEDSNDEPTAAASPAEIDTAAKAALARA